MTVREYIDKIRYPVNGLPTHELTLRPRQIYSAMISQRARVLADSFKDISDFNFTTLDCVPLERTTAYECDCIPAVGCYYHRTACIIPSALGTGKHVIKSVTTLDALSDQFIEFSYTDWSRVRYRTYEKYTSTKEQFFIRNNRIYLVGAKPDLAVATIVLLADDPVALRAECSFCETNLTNCTSYLDEEFQLDQRYVFRLIELVRIELFGLKKDENG